MYDPNTKKAILSRDIKRGEKHFDNAAKFI